MRRVIVPMNSEPLRSSMAIPCRPGSLMAELVRAPKSTDMVSLGPVAMKLMAPEPLPEPEAGWAGSSPSKPSKKSGLATPAGS